MCDSDTKWFSQMSDISNSLSTGLYKLKETESSIAEWGWAWQWGALSLVSPKGFEATPTIDQQGDVKFAFL